MPEHSGPLPGLPRVAQVNLRSAMLGTKHAARAMRAAGTRGGCIINTASIAGSHANLAPAGDPVYVPAGGRAGRWLQACASRSYRVPPIEHVPHAACSCAVLCRVPPDAAPAYQPACLPARLPRLPACLPACLPTATSNQLPHTLPLPAAYLSSKHALIGLTKLSACELAPYGIRVNAVAPGQRPAAAQPPCRSTSACLA